MNSEIKVSVIIPAYNVEKYIGDCLESILLQTIDNIEIIVVNDGSSDGTQSVIDEYSQKYPTKLIPIYQDNAGPSKARNTALKRASGEYVCFIDADDQIAFNMLEEMYITAKERNADLVMCGRKYTGVETGIYYPKLIESTTNIFETPALLSDTSSFLWDKLFKKSTLDKHGFMFDESIHYAEDALFVYSFLFYADRVCSIQKALYFYAVRREGSITGAKDSRIFGEIDACRKLADFYISVGSFEQNKRNLLWIAVGLWGRKFYSIYHGYQYKKLLFDFTCKFFDFFEKYYSNLWKDFVKKYSTKGDKKKYKRNWYKVKKKTVWIYIFAPTSLKSIVRKTRLFRAKAKKTNLVNFFKKLFNRGKSSKEPYYIHYLNARSNKDIVSNQILFIPNSGDNLACNPYYMMKDLSRRKNYILYVGTKNEKYARAVLKKDNINATPLKMDSRAFQDVLATSKYVITNYRFPTYFSKRENQIILNTWHGTPLKTLGKHMHNGLKDLGNVQSQFLACDYLIYPNEFTKEKIFDAYMLDRLYCGQAIVSGYPRNSIFYENDYIDDLKLELGVDDKKVFVFMPTWRGKSVASVDKGGDLSSILKELDSELNDDVVLYVKLHNLDKTNVKTSFKHIRQFPDNLEIYKFLNIADGLITDYSSVFFDFANTRRKIILFVYDKEQYIEERGMYLDIDTFPFDQARTTEELAELINRSDGTTLEYDYNDFCAEYCRYDNIHTANTVNNIMLSEKQSCSSESTRFIACFVSDIATPSVLRECICLSKQGNVVFVLPAKSIDSNAEDVLMSAYCKDFNFIVVQNESIFSREEHDCISRDVKSGHYSDMSKAAIERELKRIIPNLYIERAVNLTNNSDFTAMTALINNGTISC